MGRVPVPRFPSDTQSETAIERGGFISNEATVAECPYMLRCERFAMQAVTDRPL
jgi:hypothetical protein